MSIVFPTTICYFICEQVNNVLYYTDSHKCLNYQTLQPTLDGYRNKCEFTIAEGPDGGEI